MGISGLLPCLASITQTVHIKEFAGKRAAVDASVWLHRGAYGCAKELAMGTKTRRFMSFCLSRIELLLRFDVTPVLVFDGAPLPAKSATHKKRAENRELNRNIGLQFLKDGNSMKAMEYFQRSIEITSDMVHELQRELRKRGVEFLVAPYEADPQLAFLSRSGYVDFVISEDSDLLPYGCPCVLFKLDRNGEAKQIKLDQLGQNTNPNLHHFTPEQFRYACILAGCDYLDSAKSVGFKTAVTMLRRYNSIRAVLVNLRMDARRGLPDGYEEGFRAANLTFLHARVYDPREQTIRHLVPLADSDLEDDDNLPFLGKRIENDIATKVARGLVHPKTYDPYPEVEQPPSEHGGALQRSYSSPSSLSSARHRSRGARELPVQKNKVTSYFTKTVTTVNATAAFVVGRKRIRSQMSSSCTTLATAARPAVSSPRTPPVPEGGDDEEGDSSSLERVKTVVLEPESPESRCKRRKISSPVSIRSSHDEERVSRFFTAVTRRDVANGDKSSESSVNAEDEEGRVDAEVAAPSTPPNAHATPDKKDTARRGITGRPASSPSQLLQSLQRFRSTPVADGQSRGALQASKAAVRNGLAAPRTSTSTMKEEKRARRSVISAAEGVLPQCDPATSHGQPGSTANGLVAPARLSLPMKVEQRTALRLSDFSWKRTPSSG